MKFNFEDNMLVSHIQVPIHTCTITHHMSYPVYTFILFMRMNRQARVALGDRIRNSLQLTALRLKPSRLLGVQAPTLHYP